MAFKHQHIHYGTEYPIVTIRELSASDFEGDEEEIKELLEQRAARQVDRMPQLLGEFVIDKTPLDMSRLMAGTGVVHALAAHATELEFNPVWDGYRGGHFIRNGVLFGDEKSGSAAQVRDTRTFSATDKAGWLEHVGFAKNNPFDHMHRGEYEDNKGPIIVAFDRDALDEDDTNDQTKTPKDGRSIEQVVRAVYHPSGNKLAPRKRGKSES